MVTDAYAIDTDVVLKLSAYRLADALRPAMGPDGLPFVLGLTALIAPRQLSRLKGLVDRSGALDELSRLIAGLGRLEPSEDEILMAATLTSQAQLIDLPLDPGEAQLVAILRSRSIDRLVTGDKKAIQALAHLLDEETMNALAGRFLCFEQLLATVATQQNPEALRVKVCHEPAIDTAMRLAFSCGRQDWVPETFHEACRSYVADLNATAGGLLGEPSALA